MLNRCPDLRGSGNKSIFPVTWEDCVEFVQSREPVEVTGTRLKEKIHFAKKQGNERTLKKVFVLHNK